MQSFGGRIRFIANNAVNSFNYSSSRVCSSEANQSLLFSRLLPSHFSTKSYGSLRELPASCIITGIPSVASPSKTGFFFGPHMLTRLPNRGITTLNDSQKSDPQNASANATEGTPRIKFKRLDKTARNIMQILDKEAVEEVRTQREIPDIKPGYIIQLRLEVPENKRRVSTVKGIVIARRNAGLNTTIRLRRLVAGVGVESLLPLYSPNVKEIKVLDKKKVRRAKLYYLRDKMNALKK
ncbi:large ribosomal subunit protein bL19c-like [Bidens hawaiensis]|uniref:large ribosomal subunit protein bL19c-like n=1 Tax=Bidens hawaiensis TaxID=980011 RepID=UPI00404A6C99